jgi:hypothetical protein
MFRTSWQVPPPPPTTGSQTVFIFNGLLDAARGSILQPVLQWGESEAGGAAFWTISCWYVSRSGQASYRDLVPVMEGDRLVGTIELTGSSGNRFSYRCSFEGFDSLTLAVSSAPELVIATETLEAYRISTCTDYPNTPETIMGSIALAAGGVGVDPSWTERSLIQDCGQHTSIVGPDVHLHYRA